jgi:hypothetical protein
MIKTHCRFYSPVSFRVQPEHCKSATLALSEDRLVLQRMPILLVASVRSFLRASLLLTSI